MQVVANRQSFTAQARRQSGVIGGRESINSFWGTQKLCFLKFESDDKKKKVFTTDSAKNRSLLTDSGLMISILGVSGLELYSSGPSLLLFWGTILAWGAQFSFWVAQAVILGGHGTGMLPPWHRACYRLFGNFFGEICVRVNGKQSKPFHVGVGLRQGCVLSPLLFIVYMNWIDKCSQADECATIGNCKISRLLFANDLVLLSSTESGLQRALNSFADACNTAGMKISTVKTEVLHLSRNPDQCVLQVNGATLKQVEKFKYLGIAFTSDGRQDEELDTRIGKASAVMRALHYSVVMKRESSKKAKLSIFKAVFVPIHTYGHESWVTTERMRSQVQASEMRFLRRIEGLTLINKVRSSEIRKTLNIEPLFLRIERSQLRWFGHVSRMPQERLPKQTLLAKANGRRPVGRPRTRWTDYIADLGWNRLGLRPSEMMEMMEDREVWWLNLELLPPQPSRKIGQ